MTILKWTWPLWAILCQAEKSGVWGGAPDGIVIFLKEIEELWRPGTM